MLIPIKNQCVVDPIYDSDYADEGRLIKIPDAYKERADQGIVKAIGPKVVDVMVGDYVIFSGYTGTTIREGGIVYLIIPEDFVVARVAPDDIEAAGLYFQGKRDLVAERKQLTELLVQNTNLSSENAFRVAYDILESGFTNTKHFPATYAMAGRLLADAWKETEFHKTTYTGWKKKTPKIEIRPSGEELYGRDK